MELRPALSAQRFALRHGDIKNVGHTRKLTEVGSYYIKRVGSTQELELNRSHPFDVVTSPTSLVLSIKVLRSRFWIGHFFNESSDL